MSTNKDKRKYGDGWKDKRDKQRQMRVEQTNKVQGQIDNHMRCKKNKTTTKMMTGNSDKDAHTNTQCIYTSMNLDQTKQHTELLRICHVI